MAKKTRKGAAGKSAVKAPEAAPANEPAPVRKAETVPEERPAADAVKSGKAAVEGAPGASSAAQAAQERASAKPSPKPGAAAGGGPREQGGMMKGIMVAGLLAAVLFLAYYFLSMSENSFVPGTEVDAETFKGIFAHTQDIFIVMDVRGATSASNNVLQCGVDFAASSGMGGKTVTPVSLGNEGCVAPDGVHKPKDCFAMLKDGLTIYVKEGPGGAKYYSNGMVVLVGPEYTLGTCGIKAT